MAANLEIKARAADWNRQLALAGSVARFRAALWQRDTFFRVNQGRLKLREEWDQDASTASARLIAYHREDTPTPSPSMYQMTDAPDPDALKEILAGTLGVQVTVEKTRHLFLAGQTRVHLDDVRNLGRFIEIECPVQAAGPPGREQDILEDLTERLEILPGHRLAGAYADLLMACDI